MRLCGCNAAQFDIVHTYSLPGIGFPGGTVSIRAVQLSRIKDALSGVEKPIAAGVPSSG